MAWMRSETAAATFQVLWIMLGESSLKIPQIFRLKLRTHDWMIVPNSWAFFPSLRGQSALMRQGRQCGASFLTSCASLRVASMTDLPTFWLRLFPTNRSHYQYHRNEMSIDVETQTTGTLPNNSAVKGAEASTISSWGFRISGNLYNSKVWLNLYVWVQIARPERFVSTAWSTIFSISSTGWKIQLMY